MQLLTQREVANRCKMPVKWVEEAASSGKIPSPVYLDGHKRWQEKEIDEWIEAGCPRTPQSGKAMNNVQASKDALSLKQVEKEAIMSALKVVGGNREKAALLLGIGERTLYRKIQEYRLN